VSLRQPGSRRLNQGAHVKATILLGTLKKNGLSNTETLCEFLIGRMERTGIACQIVKLVDHEIAPGTYSNMGAGDEWPEILDRLLDSDIVILATPIWWANQSSLIQRVIERLDELHDRVLAGEASPLEGKVAGVVITGDSDGAQHIIGNLCNFLNAIGVLVPPYGTLSVLWEKQAKHAGTSREELLRKYEADYASTADRMIHQLLRYLRDGKQS
jgi:multimeric flavodoxin WrbA